MKAEAKSVWDRCPKCGTTVEIEVPEPRPVPGLNKGRGRLVSFAAFLFLLVFAGVNGWMVMRYSKELRTVAAISSNREGGVYFATVPIGPLWLKDWVVRHSLPFPQTVHQIEDHTPSDRVLRLAQDLPGLLVLDLSDSPEITNGGMRHLRNMELWRLSIGGPAITDAGLAHLRDMTSLRHLKISGSPQLTDAGLVQLAGLKNLTELEIHDAPRLTEEGIAGLLSSLPKAVIEINGKEVVAKD